MKGGNALWLKYVEISGQIDQRGRYKGYRVFCIWSDLTNYWNFVWKHSSLLREKPPKIAKNFPSHKWKFLELQAATLTLLLQRTKW